jgi:hypothetical protein
MGERQFTLDVYRGIKATTRAWLVKVFGHGFQKEPTGVQGSDGERQRAQGDTGGIAR